MSDASAAIAITINGRQYNRSLPGGRYALLDLIRDLGFTGTKFGCGVGKCGSCTVVMDHKAVTSCTIMAIKAEGADVTTIEGISDGFTLHPIQEAFVNHGAIQCGYCTPGIIMRLYGLLSEDPNATDGVIATEIEKNICRCTGYESIVAAAREARQKMAPDSD